MCICVKIPFNLVSPDNPSWIIAQSAAAAADDDEERGNDIVCMPSPEQRFVSFTSFTAQFSG